MQKIHSTTGKPGTLGDIPACNMGDFQVCLTPIFVRQGTLGFAVKFWLNSSHPLLTPLDLEKRRRALEGVCG